MSVKKATWLGTGTLRALAIPRGRTKTVQSALLTGAVMRLHGSYLVVQDARTGLVEHQGAMVPDEAVRTIKGFRGYDPSMARPEPVRAQPVPKPMRPVATRPMLRPVPEPEPEPVVEPDPEPEIIPEPAPVVEPEPELALEPEPVDAPIEDPISDLIATSSTKTLRELAVINGVSKTGGARVLRERLLQHRDTTGALLLVDSSAPADEQDEADDSLEDLI